MGAAGGVAAGGYLLSACSSDDSLGDDAPYDGAAPLSADRARENSTDYSTAPVGNKLPGAVDGRVLVIVDLQGGNDGLSTLVPAGDASYYDLRPNLAVAEDEVLELDNEVGLHPSLTGLHSRGITTIEGVGPINGDLSHFAMTERWERGDATGTNNFRSGFLGRLADALDDGTPLIGTSLNGPTPYLVNQQAATMSLSGPDDLWFLEPAEWGGQLAYQHGISLFNGETNVRASRVVDGFDQLSGLARQLNREARDEVDWSLPMVSDGGWLGRQLYHAGDLIAADVGLRIIYAATGDYDTHQNHQWRQAENLSQVDAAVEGFLDRATALEFDDRVLVATVSEFGRRVPENDGGLDHGTASTMLLAGPVGNERLGERPSLTDLDENGNLAVPISFDRYLATLAQEWMGVEAASVLAGEPEPLGVF